MKITPEHLKILQEAAHKVWDTYDDYFGYRSEKQERNASASIKTPSNIWFFWNQFDSPNKFRLVTHLLMNEDIKPKMIRKELIQWCIDRLNREEEDFSILVQSISKKELEK